MCTYDDCFVAHIHISAFLSEEHWKFHAIDVHPSLATNVVNTKTLPNSSNDYTIWWFEQVEEHQASPMSPWSFRIDQLNQNNQKLLCVLLASSDNVRLLWWITDPNVAFHHSIFLYVFSTVCLSFLNSLFSIIIIVISIIISSII